MIYTVPRWICLTSNQTYSSTPHSARESRRGINPKNKKQKDDYFNTTDCGSEVRDEFSRRYPHMKTLVENVVPASTADTEALIRQWSEDIDFCTVNAFKLGEGASMEATAAEPNHARNRADEADGCNAHSAIDTLIAIISIFDTAATPTDHSGWLGA